MESGTRTRDTVIAIAVALVVGGVGGYCGRGGHGPTKIERRVDTDLQQDTTFQRITKEKDSVIAARDRRIAWSDKRAKEAERLADSIQAAANQLADSISPDLPDDVEVVRLRIALAAQQRATVQFRMMGLELKDQVAEQKLAIDDLKAERKRMLGRIDTLTTDLKDLRNERKGGFSALGIHFPWWVDDAAEATAGLVIGYAVGRKQGAK